MSASEEDEIVDEEYVVEEILDHTVKDGVTHYLIKWEGYGTESNSWEPKHNLSCPELLRKYNDKVKKHAKKNVDTGKQPSSTGKKAIAQPKKLPSKSSTTTKRRKSQSVYENEPQSSASWKEMNGDEMVHEDEPSLTRPGKVEYFTMIDDSNSDEYATDEEDDFEKDYSASFIYPEEANPSKIVNLCSINEQQYFIIQFDDIKTYYITPEVATKNCEIMVDKYYAKKSLEKGAIFRDP